MNIFDSIYQSEIFFRLNLLLLSNLVLIPYTIRTVRNILYQTFLWQLKEYRWDRMKTHLNTTQGKKLIFGYLSILKFLPIVYALILYSSLYSSYFVYIYQSISDPVKIISIFLLYFYIPILIYYFESLLNIYELFKRGWRMPKWTIKASLIVLLSLIVWAVVSFGIYFWMMGIDDDLFFIFLLVADKILPLVIGLVIFLLNIPTQIYKKWIINQAVNKIARLDSLIVIGITGSYGKTSTKEFLYQILSAKYKVLKTEGSTNTEIGVAKTILDKLDKSHEIFIVEMGAYKKGEIAAICNIVKPKIGIITGINHQHVALFGSIEETMKTKYELIRNLKTDGKAVFNAGNSYVKEIWLWAKEERPDLTLITYQHHKTDNKDCNLSVSDINVLPDKLLFRIIYDNKSIVCETKLAGVQNIDNILAAAAVSLELGLSAGEIQQAINSLKAPEKTMKIAGQKNKLIFIDDSFNANPDGVLSALKYLQLYKGKKILVLTPLIELGTEADVIHKQLGEEASRMADLVLLTNSNYSKSFIKGAGNVSSKTDKVKIVSYSDAVNIIKGLSSQEGIVIFEGKEAGKILERLLIVD